MSSGASSRRRVLALTGTPGVGKTSLAGRLRRRGVTVLGLDEFLDASGVAVGRDRRRGSIVVDVDVLDRRLRPALAKAQPPIVVEGHLSHHLPAVTEALVLRLRPSVLVRRLRRRGWPMAKVRENAEAEAIDLILQESVERFGERRTWELDVTGLRRHEVAARVADVAHRRPGALKNVQIGRVSWAAEILRWY